MAKKHKHPEHVNHERWLVSYADFITLLFAFFVVLFSSSSVERSTSKKMSLAINVAFDELSIFKEKSGDSFEPSESGGGGGSAQSFREIMLVTDHSKKKIIANNIDHTPSNSPPTGPYEHSMHSGYLGDPDRGAARLKRTLMNLLEKKKISNNVKIKDNLDDLTLTIEQRGLYKPGSDEYSADAEKAFIEIGKILKEVPNQVRIEGHTDSNPADNGQTNLILSAKRATRVVEKLIFDHKLDPSRFSAVGLGSLYPVADNETEEGRGENRRVDIKILSESQALKEAPRLSYQEKSSSQGLHESDNIELPFQ